MLTTLAALGAFGTMALIGAVLLVCFLMFLVEAEKGRLTTLIVVVAVAVFLNVTKTDPRPWLAGHVWQTAAGVVAYLALGTGWSVIKWVATVARKARTYRDLRADFLRRYELSTLGQMPADVAKEFADAMRRAGLVPRRARPAPGDRWTPQVRDHRSLILMWMTYWPLSAVATALRDPIRRAFVAIYNRIGGWMQGLADRIYRDIEAEREAMVDVVDVARLP